MTLSSRKCFSSSPVAAVSLITLLLVVCISAAEAAQHRDEDEQANSRQGSDLLATATTNKTEKNRKEKYLTLFSVVRFKNTVCTGNNNLNGTCLTSVECDQRGGTGAGSCAAGYGVCCTITLGCGSMSSANCTYFQSSGSEVGACRLRICPCGNNICQLRLDFISFAITGPSSATTSSVDILNGATSPAGLSSTTSSRCLADTFSVTNPGGQSSDLLCGTNTGEHSPQGCDQYYFGSTSNSIRTFNYNSGNGHHLAEQDQNICVRRERGFCRICYTVQADIDFRLSGTNTAQGEIGGSKCCAYGNTGMAVSAGGFDCVQIPGAVNTANAMLTKGNNICGHRFVTMPATAGPKTICSQRTPFELRFLSDAYDGAIEASRIAAIANDVGFELIYVMTTC